MNKQRRRHRHVPVNEALRQELIDKSIITPPYLVPQRLKARGFLLAAAAAEERLLRGNLYGQRR
jgi:hypothetical protein